MSIIAPELPKNYRFKVRANYYKNNTAVFLQHKWLGLIWINIDYHFAFWPDRADSIYTTMLKLIKERLSPRGSAPFDGYYPPLKEIGT